MAGSVNKVILVGHLGGDPEVKAAQNGNKIATLSIATSDSWRDKTTGERKQKTEWHRVVIFSEGLVKICEQYLKKGAHVYLEGKLRTRKWQDKDGKDRYSTEVVLEAFNSTLTMLDKSSSDRPPTPSGEDDYGRTSSGTRPATGGGRNDDMNDDIPF